MDAVTVGQCAHTLKQRVVFPDREDEQRPVGVRHANRLRLRPGDIGAATRRRLYRESATRDDVLAIVRRRRDAVREYLEWAKANDDEQWTFRIHARPDIARAAEAATLFPDAW